MYEIISKTENSQKNGKKWKIRENSGKFWKKKGKFYGVKGDVF